MLQKQMENYIKKSDQTNTIELFKFEEEYARKLELLPTEVTVEDRTIVYESIEKCTKETEEVLAKETAEFLSNPMSYLKNQIEEFIFVESEAFEVIGVDGIALECDDVFGTYSALFGLKLQKKYGDAIKTFLDDNLTGDGQKYSVMFSIEDGLWDMNFALDYMPGFKEDQSIQQAIEAFYHFVFKLALAVEDGK